MPTTSAVLRPLKPCSTGASAGSGAAAGSTGAVLTPFEPLVTSSIVPLHVTARAGCSRQVPPAKLLRRDQYGEDHPGRLPPLGRAVAIRRRNRPGTPGR